MINDIKGDYSYSIGCHPWDSNIPYNKLFDIKVDYNKKFFVGEIGLDSEWCKIPFDIQKERFIFELEQAKKHKKKCILHTKGMEKEILDIISKYSNDFIVHWYACDNYIEDYIKIGSYFTIGYVIKYEKEVRKLAQLAPLDHLLYETDGLEAIEWLTKTKVKFEDMPDIYLEVLNEISKIKNIPIETIHQQLYQNSLKLLNNQ
ncbi:hydrolase of PHP superfamily-related protein [Trichomonas vaginalis G3]|uniref:Hydrolase of PHP superfamily-related protein n=1 Tax=Trichomonas vaginalis (strain ATCC PRA-98 / G3) TaxID=412133 RepID=A2F0T5_TRIV3|nr:hydrolase of PHP superfamily-related protein family [Trichomonas vaginalis G3]EAY01470.1 hydrolase of PHP superfamily-related protein [Trichomonas vaginalis G3]KAI5523372.1 hydrolase of PHP superfamily-related protein family [Trichomonas vaginalis G3]|eukprot:XP_001314161.1 hydrolase of PHP superfamily-related protein [Trichomonas vaginalis G3]